MTNQDFRYKLLLQIDKNVLSFEGLNPGRKNPIRMTPPYPNFLLENLGSALTGRFLAESRSK